MAKQVIGIGNAANDGSGDPLRTAGDKICLLYTSPSPRDRG